MTTAGGRLKARRCAIGRPLAALGAAVLLGTAGVTLTTAATAAPPLPSFDQVRATHRPSDLPVLDRHGQTLQWVRWDTHARRGPWVPLDEVSPALREALLLSEDQRFWAHAGVDWAALAASAWRQAWNQRTRGASTLTMQLAALLDPTLARPAGGRSVGGKLEQMHRARQLEARWSKVQILEAYLNRVPLRGETVGVWAASQLLFGRLPHALDRTEAALLAALVRAPNADATTLQRRACAVLRQQALGCETLAVILPRALSRSGGPMPGERLAPHVARQVLASLDPESDPLSLPTALHTTLDAGMQRVAREALQRQLAELRGRAVTDGAVLVLDNASGAVLAWVGAAGATATAPAVDGVLARRQPGSTLKPLLYALALQKRLVTAASAIDDSPLRLNTGQALYRPQNYDLRHHGAVSLRTALAASLNVPAVRVSGLVGADAFFDTLTAAGLAPRENAGYHGPALALGSADVTLLALTNAYRMLARGGRLQPIHLQPATTGRPRPVGARSPAPSDTPLFEPAVAWLVSDILADSAARAPAFGLDSPLVTRGWAAVKTGTSKDMRDNWCIGYTDRYTVGVWVGNADGSPMHGVSGVSGAAPVWRALVAALHADQASRAPSRPPGLVQRQGEWFLAGTEPPADAPTLPRGSGVLDPVDGIRSPADGTVIVLDPDIPRAAQRLAFEGGPGRWSLNGRPLGSGRVLHWEPRPGRHRLQWWPADGSATSQTVQFEVRAPTIPAPRPSPRATAFQDTGR